MARGTTAFCVSLFFLVSSVVRRHKTHRASAPDKHIDGAFGNSLTTNKNIGMRSGSDRISLVAGVYSQVLLRGRVRTGVERLDRGANHETIQKLMNCRTESHVGCGVR
jgi:hypothetical protein